MTPYYPAVVVGLVLIGIGEHVGGAGNLVERVIESGWLLAAVVLGVAAIPLWHSGGWRWLRRHWPPERCVTIHHWRKPRVTKVGDVEAFLRVINHSPFPVLLHSPTFLLHVNNNLTTGSKTTPVRIVLEPHGRTDTFRVEATVQAQAMWNAAQPPSHVLVYVSQSFTVERVCDHASAEAGVLGDPGAGDPPAWVDVV